MTISEERMDRFTSHGSDFVIVKPAPKKPDQKKEVKPDAKKQSK